MAKYRHLADRDLRWSALNQDYSVQDHRLVYPPRKAFPRAVVITGASGDGATDPLLDNPDLEVWGINLIPPMDAHGCVRADRWFDLHQRKAQTADDMRWIANCPRPIYVPPDLLDAGPNCVLFPLGNIMERLLMSEPDWMQAPPFACTFAYQIALALHEGFRSISLLGVELSRGTRRERTVEWASVNWWLGFARARGVQVNVAPSSRLGQHEFLYGFQYDEEIAEVREYVESTAGAGINMADLQCAVAEGRGEDHVRDLIGKNEKDSQELYRILEIITDRSLGEGAEGNAD